MIAVCCSILGIAGIALSPQRKSSQVPPSRVDIAARDWADESSCIDCHTQAERFFQTGHAQTLSRMTDPQMISLLSSLNECAAAKEEGTSVHVNDDTVAVKSQSHDFSSEATIPWCFGSGRHARTWVSTFLDSNGNTELLEFRWTWYHQSNGFDVTPGQPDLAGEGHFNRLGVYFDSPMARRCFECHASSLHLEHGQIDESSIRCGVTCQRCHGAMASHVASGGDLKPMSLKGMDHVESVQRCAECHRDPTEFDPKIIVPENTAIPRFQPIGLMQSKCFQSSEMSCLFCHDPHRPMESQDSRGDWQCTQCHDGAHDDRPRCGAGQTSSCIRCHMPKVPMRRPVGFTDHWIRVRREGVRP